ncbi:MAG: signal peptidase [Acidimicrobiales bacterium]|nr:signal peptidase [Acidimicrobiales bacterium]
MEDGRNRASTSVQAPGAVASPAGPPLLGDAGQGPPDGSVVEGEPVATVPPARRSSTRNLIEWVAVVVGAVLVALVVKTFLFQAFWIPTGSMEKTLVRGDRVLVNKLAYKFHDVHRGDVVVFERPATFEDNSVKDLIKRVIGLPGEHLAIHDGRVYVNGRQLDEPYTSGQATDYHACGAGDVRGIDTPQGMTVPQGTVLVMGDNRNNSSDGRCFGPLKTNLIVGRAFLIIWPPSKIHTL